MKLSFIPLLFNTARARYFDTAIRVLRRGTLSKCRVMPKYARAQNSRSLARSSNTRMSLTMFSEITSLFLQNQLAFYIFRQKNFIYIKIILDGFFRVIQKYTALVMKIPHSSCRLVQYFHSSCGIFSHHTQSHSVFI